MRRARAFWLLGLLSCSCAVSGFSIVDELPGAAGGAAGVGGGTSSVGGVPSGTAGSAAQGGKGGSGAVAQGGQGGTAGTLGDAGSSDAGEPGQGQAGAGGEGGAPPVSGALAPCAQSNGVPPMFCDDFESGFDPSKWTPPPGIMPESGQGPHGVTKLVHLTGAQLAANVTDFNLATGDELTLSFWLKSVQPMAGAVLASFRDRTAAGSDLRLTLQQNELGWASSSSNFRVPETATGARLPVNEWTCVNIYFTEASMVLTYGAGNGSGVVNTLTVDDTATPGIDANWQMMTRDARFVGGHPVFGGAVNGLGSEIFLDDVRLARDRSSVCAF